MRAGVGSRCSRNRESVQTCDRRARRWGSVTPTPPRRWKQCIEAKRLPGPRARYRGQAPTQRTSALEARALAKTRQKLYPTAGIVLDANPQVGEGAGNQSHAGRVRLVRRLRSGPSGWSGTLCQIDPLFEGKGCDDARPLLEILAAARRRLRRGCQDGESRRLHRLDPVPPVPPGRAESPRTRRPPTWHFLVATRALNKCRAPGRFIGQTRSATTDQAPRFPSSFESIWFCSRNRAAARDSMPIVDNLVAHKTKGRRRLP